MNQFKRSMKAIAKQIIFTTILTLCAPVTAGAQSVVKELKENVNQLNTQVADLEEDTKAKEQEINEKTNQMNEAYVFIGDKSALKAAGLAQGGSLFKKLKLDASNIDKKLFQKIDIREITTFQIPDDKAEVLSQMPADSYKITKTGNDASVLTITNPDRFWSVSKYLIIKYKFK